MRTLRERITHSFLHIQDAARRKKEKEGNKVKDQISQQLSRLCEATAKKERKLAEIKVCSKDIDLLRDKLIALVRLTRTSPPSQQALQAPTGILELQHTYSEQSPKREHQHEPKGEHEHNEHQQDYEQEYASNPEHEQAPEQEHEQTPDGRMRRSEYLQQLEDMSSSSSVSSSDEFADSSRFPAQPDSEHGVSTSRESTGLDSPNSPTYSPHYFHHSAGAKACAEGGESPGHNSPGEMHASPVQGTSSPVEDTSSQSPEETTDTSTEKGIYRTIQQKLGINPETPKKNPDEPKEAAQNEHTRDMPHQEKEGGGSTPSTPEILHEKINLTLRPSNPKGYLSVIGGEIRRGKKQNPADKTSPARSTDVPEKSAGESNLAQTSPEALETQQAFSTSRKLVEEKLQAIRKEGTLEDDRRLYNILSQTIDSLKGRTDFESLRISAQLDIARKYVKDFIELRNLLQTPGALKKQALDPKKRARYTH